MFVLFLFLSPLQNHHALQISSPRCQTPTVAFAITYFFSFCAQEKREQELQERKGAVITISSRTMANETLFCFFSSPQNRPCTAINSKEYKCRVTDSRRAAVSCGRGAPGSASYSLASFSCQSNKTLGTRVGPADLPPQEEKFDVSSCRRDNAHKSHR